tara:strand:+ start:203 stop:454 length:252 start_codon:yes stop_codon:yes gene_type:complete
MKTDKAVERKGAGTWKDTRFYRLKNGRIFYRVMAYHSILKCIKTGKTTYNVIAERGFEIDSWQEVPAREDSLNPVGLVRIWEK